MTKTVWDKESAVNFGIADLKRVIEDIDIKPASIMVGSVFPMDCPACKKETEFAKISMLDYMCLECERLFQAQEE